MGAPLRGEVGLPADLGLDEVDDGVGGRLDVVTTFYVFRHLADQLFLSTRFRLPTTGVIGIPSSELRHRLFLLVGVWALPPRRRTCRLL